MKPKRSKKEKRTVRVWTFDEARKASPYITGVMQSLREHRLEAITRDRQAKRLADRPGRPDRHLLVTQADTARLSREADIRCEESLAELHAIDVFCADPIRGEAFIPFLHTDKLAWFVFDLFGEDHIKEWRFHDDPLETRRPISEAITVDPTNIAFTV